MTVNFKKRISRLNFSYLKLVLKKQTKLKTTRKGAKSWKEQQIVLDCSRHSPNKKKYEKICSNKTIEKEMKSQRMPPLEQQQ